MILSNSRLQTYHAFSRRWFTEERMSAVGRHLGGLRLAANRVEMREYVQMYGATTYRTCGITFFYHSRRFCTENCLKQLGDSLEYYLGIYQASRSADGLEQLYGLRHASTCPPEVPRTYPRRGLGPAMGGLRTCRRPAQHEVGLTQAKGQGSNRRPEIDHPWINPFVGT